MITIKKWFARKIFLGNYETADFGCELATECEQNHDQVSKELYDLAKKLVERDISEFQSNILRDKIEAKIKTIKSELEILKRFPEENKLKINTGEFQLSLLTDELDELKGKAK